jgi:DNA-binding transcriptional LysR family regulator
MWATAKRSSSVLEAHEADVAISGQAPGERGFEGAPFLDNEFVLITSPDDPLAKARPGSLLTSWRAARG